MPSIYKRKSDKARPGGKWSYSYVGEDGRRKSRVGVADKARTRELAAHAEAEARKVRDGLAEPGAAARLDAAKRPVAAHVEDYRLGILARGGKPGHARDAANAVARVLADASVTTVADLAPDRVSAALGRLKAKRCARTANFALWAVRSFARWLSENDRIRDVPKGLARLRPYHAPSDRRRNRRALTAAEVGRLLSAAPAEREALYRCALGTGFRANELRSLVKEDFDLEGRTVYLSGKFTKNKKRAAQPINRELAEFLRPFVHLTVAGAPVFDVPDRTADMLKVDLEAAGIPFRDGEGRTVDFHAIRTTYITLLILKGVNPKVVQKLARHSTIVLTLDFYTTVEDSDLRKAVDG